jgi:hypothetical protein
MALRLILVIMGGCFLAFGIAFYIWGRAEEEKYYNTIVHRYDVREYLERLPFRPEPGALRIGGITAIALGILMIIAGSILWFFNIDTW